MLEKDQKMDKILELVDPTRDFSQVGWRWAPYNAINTDVEQIAANIEEESYSLFRRIRFEDWVRYLTGYEEESVEDLFFQHRVLTHKIRCYLLRHRDERGKYTQVTEKLRNRSPLAHQALLHCLSSASYLPTSLSLPFDLEVISGPLGSLMGDRTLPLSAMLDILPILAIRFNRTYIRAMPFAWPRFTIRVDVLKALIASNPTEFAKDVTISDKKDFDRLCPDAFKTRAPHLIYMNMKWNSFCDAIAECCEAHPGLSYHLGKIAQVRIAQSLVNNFSS
ncbi:MAG: hypothetical protein M1835_003429 [Candelina submexicana]|nr:MAG: hypothetical protein M1835_003429 [Candelina submexicana]